MNQISISTCFDYSIPIEQQLLLIRKAGFDRVSIGGNYEHSGILDKNILSNLKAYISEYGLTVDTIHGYDLDNTDTLEVNKKIAEAASELKAPVIVIHCSSTFTFDPSETSGRRRDITEKLPALEALARGFGVKFALENIFPGIETDLTEEIIGMANPDYFGFCYDSSHDQIGGPRSFDLLERLSDRLIAVHISDRIREFVDHVIPGEGFIDYDQVCHLLRLAQMNFPLLMEVKMTHSRYKEPEVFLNAAYREAVRLYGKIYQKEI